ncbi:hypothetical protein MLD38_016203 [Melastoma candidum]|uniref:Uncharacterized protein n=1 Tax=Melastoma candidum TaxID=119954 RepID=A0ACB9RMC2_9MYRT|nr:hypothetical protein MLD38_016203 [Melastoma candidum]
MEQPPSPAKSASGLRQCVHHLLKFILQSRVDGAPDVMRKFLDPLTAVAAAEPDSAPPAPSVSVGVPEYPLYEWLALALHEAILSGGMPQRSDYYSCSHLAFSSCGDDKSRKQVFDELISRQGSQLLDILKDVRFEIHVQEPYFSLLRDGKKTVEGRRAGGDHSRIKSGDLILLNQCLVFQVQFIHHYASFYEMLEGEDLEIVLPGILSIEEGSFTPRRERSKGVLGIGVSKSSSQPYICLAQILSGLSYEGIHQLLGFVHTVGTICESLPPPASVLLSAFQQPYNPD